MKEKNPLTVSLIVTVGIICVGLTVFLGGRGIARVLTNKAEYTMQKIDDVTNYETIKKVEDTLRAFIASYEADKITWETNKNLDSMEAQQLAMAALTRANRTAATYNQYYLKNSFIWKDNVPDGIETELPYLGTN